MTSPIENDRFLNHFQRIDLQGGDDTIHDIGQLISSIGYITERLPVFKMADRWTSTLEFFARSKHEYAYPTAVEDWSLGRELSSVRISITKELDDTPTSSIEFIDAEGDSLYASRDPESMEHINDVVIESGNPKEFGRIPNNEMNHFLASVAAKDFEPASIADPDQPVNAANLYDALSSNAIGESTTYTFEYERDEIETITYSAVRSGNQIRLTDINVRYKTGGKRVMSVIISRVNGLSLSFEVSDPELGICAHDPDDGDYIRIKEIISAERNRLDPLHKDSLDPSDSGA